MGAISLDLPQANESMKAMAAIAGILPDALERADEWTEEYRAIEELMVHGALLGAELQVAISDIRRAIESGSEEEKSRVDYELLAAQTEAHEDQFLRYHAVFEKLHRWISGNVKTGRLDPDFQMLADAVRGAANMVADIYNVWEDLRWYLLSMKVQYSEFDPVGPTYGKPSPEPGS